MSGWEAAVIFAGGLFAGVVNAMAGGGSLLTVPLLSLGGVEGLAANGTNRVAVLVQTVASGVGFARRGVGGRSHTIRILPPVLLGGAVGAFGISQIDDDAFNLVFGLLMIPLLVLALSNPRADRAVKPWPPWVVFVVFFGVGAYAGAIQAGVGIVLLLVLTRLGLDLVTANAVKTYVVIAVSAIAVVIFVAQDQVEWGPAAVLSAGTGLGGFLGANIAVSGGERVIRPVLIVSVVALSGRMIGLY